MPSLKDIAVQLNLTPASVSFALNGRTDKVSEATRQRVLQAARDLNYVPNPAARALISGRTGNIGFVSHHYDNPLFIQLLHEVAVAVDARGDNLLTCVTGRDSRQHGQDQLLHSQVVDGLFAVRHSLPGMNSMDSPWRRLPLVVLFADWGWEESASVRFDDADGAAQVARHLWESGHRAISFVHGRTPVGNVYSFSQDRLRFFQDAWRDGGGQPENDIEVCVSPATAEGGFDAVEALLAGRARSNTAIVVSNDSVAVGAIAALRARGLRVPDDVSLVGWNDLGDMPGYLDPPLTSVRVSLPALARTAVDTLYQRIGSRVGPSVRKPESVPPSTRTGMQVLVPVELIVRASTRAV